MSVEINKNSRLQFHDLTILNGIELWAIDYEPQIAKNLTDTQYPLKETESLDGLAYDFYKNEVLWWIIAKNNGIYDIFNDMDLYMVEWDENVVDTNGNLTGNVNHNTKDFTGLLNAELFIENLANKGITGNLVTKTMILNIPSTTRIFSTIF